MASKTQKRTKHSPSEKRPLSSWPLGKTLYLTLLAAIVGIFVLPFTESLALWGIAYPSFVMGNDFYILLAAALVAAVWALKPAKEQSTVSKKQPALYWAFAAIVIVGVAWTIQTFPVAFAFLGDGTLYVGEVFRLATLPDYQSGLMKATTWLGGWIVTWVAQHGDIEQANEAFRITGLVSFVALGAGAFLLLSNERWQIVLLWILLLLGTGGMLLFFGYIELYAPGYALVCLYLLSVWAVLRSDLHPAVSVSLLLLSIAATASNAIFIPSLLLLLHWKFKGTDGKPTLKQTVPILIGLPILAVILLYVVFGLGKGNPYLIPVSAVQHIEQGINFGTQSYTLFAGVHLVDVINVIYLTSGLSALLLVVPLLAGRSVKWSDPRVLFGVVAASGTLLLCLTGNTTFGMARDWDIMVATGPALAFFVVAILAQLWEQKKLPIVPFLPLIAILALAPSYFWIKVNAETAPSAERFTNLVERYEPYVTPGYTYNALENLRKYHFAENNSESYINTLIRMSETRYDMLANFRELIGALKRPDVQPFAKEKTDAMLAIVVSAAEYPLPENDFRHIAGKDLQQFAVQALLGAKEAGYPGIAQSYVPRFKSAFGTWPEFAIYEAYQYPREEPERRYQAIQNVDISSLTDIALIIRAANITKNANQVPEAIALYERALQIDKNQYQNVYLTLAELYYRAMKDKQKTVETLQRCITNCVGSQAAEKAKEILAQLQAGG